MKSILMIFWLVCFLCSGILAAQAATHYLVPTNNTGGAINPYDSWGTAGTSVIDVVKAAMTNAETPRIVWVTNGVYVLTNAVTTITNDVVLKSVNGRDVTIFDGKGLYRCFNLQHTNCILDGLTISNGFAGNGGGGIRISGGTVTNCRITGCLNNSAGWATPGGGIAIVGTGIVVNSVITGNISTNEGGGGGGLYLYDVSSSMIENCLIEMNIAYGHGGGIGIGGAATIRNCLIRYNTAANGGCYGGGLSIGSTNAHVINCTIVSNTAWVAAGINFAVSQTNTVINCIVANNYAFHPGYQCIYNIDGYAAIQFSSCAYSCSTPGNNAALFSLTGTGNTSSDPGFIDFAGGNYRFNRTSPCFNSGTNQTDWMNSAVDLAGNLRIRFGRVDMGAYEWYPRIKINGVSYEKIRFVNGAEMYGINGIP